MILGGFMSSERVEATGVPSLQAIVQGGFILVLHKVYSVIGFHFTDSL